MLRSNPFVGFDDLPGLELLLSSSANESKEFQVLERSWVITSSTSKRTAKTKDGETEYTRRQGVLDKNDELEEPSRNLDYDMRDESHSNRDDQNNESCD